jgi:hypothetical protein
LLLVVDTPVESEVTSVDSCVDSDDTLLLAVDSPVDSDVTSVDSCVDSDDTLLFAELSPVDNDVTSVDSCVDNDDTLLFAELSPVDSDVTSVDSCVDNDDTLLFVDDSPVDRLKICPVVAAESPFKVGVTVLRLVSAAPEKLTCPFAGLKTIVSALPFLLPIVNVELFANTSV